MVTAVFAFLGTELVGVTVGEAENPRKVSSVMFAPKPFH